MNEHEINQNVVEALDKAERHTSPELRNELSNARLMALKEAENHTAKRWGLNNQWLVGTAAFASLALVIAIAYPPDVEKPSEESLMAGSTMEPLGAETKQDGSSSAVNDLILLAALDETEYEVANNLEFTYWLSEELGYEPQTNSPKPSLGHNG